MLKCEYFLPFVVDELLKEGKISVKVMDTTEKWYGVTYKEDKQPVVDAISQNTNISTEYISKMFDHLFVNEYDLDKGHVRFDTDYDIAESVQRLRDGKNIQEHDLILVYHEAMEHDLMNNDGLGYEEAHERANMAFNYQKALDQWLDELEK
jgi:cell division protein YceG involved in septum cleavage